MSSSRRALLSKLHDFLKMQGRVEKTPGFSSALGLSYESLVNKKDVVMIDEKNVTLRYPSSVTTLMSTYLAAIDDVTTWALVLGDDKRSRPGKSISLSLWACPDITTIASQLGDEVNIVASVEKIGNNVGFCNATVKDAATNKLVCYASHVKYLPMGPLFDMALSAYGWKAATIYAEHFLEAPSAEQSSLSDLFDSLTYVSDTTATFHVEPIHASLGGPIHGGCQAILMEMVASHVAKRRLKSDDVTLDSIQIQYMSPPRSKSGNVDIHAETLSCDDVTGSIILLVQIVGDGRTKSKGILTFSSRQL